MQVWSDAFSSGEQMPQHFTRDGANVSPPLSWADVPQSARELAVLFENVTPSTREPFAQWIVYGIPPQARGLPEGLRHKRDPDMPEPALHGTNDIGNVGYDGPLGSVGRDVRYRLRLIAVDRPLGLAPGADRRKVLRATSGHVVAEAALDTHYERFA